MVVGLVLYDIRIPYSFWTPYVIHDADPTELELQNRIGMLLAMAAILSLTLIRANRRERMLGG